MKISVEFTKEELILLVTALSLGSIHNMDKGVSEKFADLAGKMRMLITLSGNK